MARVQKSLLRRYLKYPEALGNKHEKTRLCKLPCDTSTVTLQGGVTTSRPQAPFVGQLSRGGGNLQGVNSFGRPVYISHDHV